MLSQRSNSLEIPVLSSGGSVRSATKRRSSVAFAPIITEPIFSENTPPSEGAYLRPTSALLGSALKAPCSGPRLSTGSNVSWAPDVLSPPPSRERLHKRARGLSDEALEEAGY